MKTLNLQNLSRPEAFQTTISRKVRAKALKISKDITGTILDVGCGNGLFLLECCTSLVDQSRTFGLDHDYHALKNAHRIFMDNNLSPDKFISGNAFNLPFQSNYFDAVFCLNTLINIHPFDDIEALIKELHRVCNKKGKIIFDYRNLHNPVLKLKYISNTITGRLTTHGHYLKDFQPLFRQLNIKNISQVPIGSSITIFSLGFLTILEK
ncbi:class I SAM-dependent methyltransferase [bacterium]|nr:class I SAM-dependent methyltransferase [bacterium]